MEFKDLSKVGLTEGEIKVYEALLSLGESTKTSLAKESGVSPSNIYDVTNRLLEKGIISKIEKNGVAHFSPANPNYFLNFIGSKEDELKKEKEFIKNILPNLTDKYKSSKEKTKIEYFQGWNGLKTVFDDLIQECKKGDINYVFGASKGESEKQADIFFLKYSKIREEKGIITKIIFNEELKNAHRINFFKKSKNYQVKFFLQSTPSEILLYKNITLIIILTKNPLVIRIMSEDVQKSFKQYFDVLWKLARN